MNGQTHDYPTKAVLAKDVDDTMVLVGESGGLSAIYGSRRSVLVPSMMSIETEHGQLVVSPERGMTVLDLA